MSKVTQADPSAGTKPITFAEKFCSAHHLPVAGYPGEMLRRSLYSPGKLAWRLLGTESGCFAADREFIEAVGKLTSLHGFEAEMWAFTVNPENSRFHRLHLKMRVSSKRVYQQLVEIMRPNHSSAHSGHAPTSNETSAGLKTARKSPPREKATGERNWGDQPHPGHLQKT